MVLDRIHDVFMVKWNATALIKEKQVLSSILYLLERHIVQSSPMTDGFLSKVSRQVSV